MSRTVLTNRDGYALHVRCHGRNPVGYPAHPGQARLAIANHSENGRRWQCQGCGAFVSEETVLAEQFAGICDGTVE